jgi:hypothetical protein
MVPAVIRVESANRSAVKAFASASFSKFLDVRRYLSWDRRVSFGRYMTNQVFGIFEFGFAGYSREEIK